MSDAPQTISPNTIFSTFLKLGLTAFGGPVAHVAYFRQVFVKEKKWLDDQRFAELMAMSQMLPGPGSSQLGFSIGLIKGGVLGGLAAFLAFTLPSVLLLILFAGMLSWFDHSLAQAGLHGLKVLALCVVLQGIVGMYKNLCPDLNRKVMALGSAVLMLLAASPQAQLGVIALGAIAGMAVCQVQAQPSASLKVGYSATTGIALMLGAAVLLGLAIARLQFGVFFDYVRAGSLVFGGGHVVLPLLEQTAVGVGSVSSDEFMAGYGAAQLIPGPMFSFASYLGWLSGSNGGLVGATLATVGIFLPGFLLMAGMLPVWHRLSGQSGVQKAIAGINAAVVGLLVATLYDPIFSEAVGEGADMAVALFGLFLLFVLKKSILTSALGIVSASILVALLSTALG